MQRTDTVTPREEVESVDVRPDGLRALRDRGDAVRRSSLLAKLEQRLFERRQLEHEPLKLSRYVLDDQIGAGAMGVVYRARDPLLEREIAIKLIRIGRGSRRSIEEAQGRLRREAHALARLNHPNIVTVYDVGTCTAEELAKFDERGAVSGLFVVMELVEGTTVDRWIRRARPGPAEVLEVFRAAGRGLAAAHGSGVVHRDFKPSNVMVGKDGQVRVLDFGLARPISRHHSGFPSLTEPELVLDGVSESELPTHLTRTGDIAGTPAYMAPEAFRDRHCDFYTDQFSFFVALYESLYGHRPFPANSVEQLVDAVTNGRFAPEPRPSPVPRSLRRVLLRGLSAAPELRYPSMRHAVDALQMPRRGRGFASAAAIAAMIGTASVLYAQDAPDVCTSMAERIDGTWTDDQRRGVERAFADIGSKTAMETWGRLREQLDARRAGLASAWARACEHRPQGPEEGCYEAQREQLARYVEELRGVEPATITGLVDRLAELPTPEWCETEGYTPPTVAQRVDLGRIEAGLRRARARIDAGDPSAALEEPTIEEVDAVGYPPLAAEVRLVQAIAMEHLGQIDEAARLLDDAFHLASGAGVDAVALACASRAIALHGVRRGDAAVAERWHQHARAVASRSAVGQRSIEAAEVTAQWAASQHAHGRHRDALGSYRQALEILHAIGADEHPTAASVLNNVGIVHDELGELRAAATSYEHALDVELRVHGRMHPKTAAIVNNLAVLDARSDRRERALTGFGEALRIREEIGTPTQIAETLTNLGQLSIELGRLDEAEAYLRRATELQSRVPPEQASMARTAFALGRLAGARNRWAEAAAAFRRAAGWIEALHGPRHPELIAPLVAMAEARSRHGEHGPAIDDLDRAYEVAVTAFGSAHPQVLGVLRMRGHARMRMGDARAAVDDFRRAAIGLRVSGAADQATIEAVEDELRRAVRAASEK